MSSKPKATKVRVTAKSLIPNEQLHQLDKEELTSICGDHFYNCQTEDPIEEALDRYHEGVAIKVLDDFEIIASVV